MKQSERSFKFRKNYLNMRAEGMTVKEISGFYGISTRHAYNLLRKEAKELGISYESLIDRPHVPHLFRSDQLVKPAEPVDFSGFEKNYRESLSSFDKTIYQMDKILEDWPVMPEDLKEE